MGSKWGVAVSAMSVFRKTFRELKGIVKGNRKRESCS